MPGRSDHQPGRSTASTRRRGALGSGRASAARNSSASALTVSMMRALRSAGGAIWMGDAGRASVATRR